MSSLLCLGCGFVCYSPRPDEKDLEAKYRFLDGNGADGNRDLCALVEEDRAQRLFRSLRRYLGRSAEVLDFGGGDGRLMRGFLQVGHRCYLLDYGRNVVPGVNKLGDTLADLPVGGKFDLIVCNHVLEHVAEPRRVLEKLREHLRNDGVIFVEVPMEIWRQPPLAVEPVTHTNFFVPGSLREMLGRAGLHVVYNQLGAYRHSGGRLLPAVRAIARRRPEIQGESHDGDLGAGVVEVGKYLAPTFAVRFQRALAMREALPSAVGHQFLKLGERAFRR